jgi:hypothetical protein
MFCRILVSVDEDLVTLDIPRWGSHMGWVMKRRVLGKHGLIGTMVDG